MLLNLFICTKGIWVGVERSIEFFKDARQSSNLIGQSQRHLQRTKGNTMTITMATELRIFNRTTSPAFFSHLKTALFDRAGVGSASE